MKSKILLCVLMLWSLNISQAQELPKRVSTQGAVLFVTNINNTIRFVSAPTNVTHWYVLAQFMIENRDGDSPKKITISGRIKDRNAGFPAEQLPLFFGSDLHLPRLAAITDSHGSFSFNVTLKTDSRGGALESSAITNGAIYVGNANIYSAKSFDEKCNLKSGLIRKYELADLLPSNSSNNKDSR